MVKDGDKVLDSGYTVTYSNNTNVGTAKVTVAVGSDKAEVEFKIVKDKNPSVSMADMTVTFGASYTMTATAKTSAGNEIKDGTITIEYYTNEECTEGRTTDIPTNAGIYYAKATLTETTNYAEATKVATIPSETPSSPSPQEAMMAPMTGSPTPSQWKQTALM